MSFSEIDHKKPRAIFLMGPTASGKTGLAMALAQRLPCEIISVDSALVYRGLDIGTAKPSAGELAIAPHRLIDIRDPAEPYSAADFRQDALRAMADIVAEGKVPLLVGGTMLYFKVLYHGLADMPPADQQIRSDIEALAKQHGWPFIHEQLKAVDPASAARINPNDPQRLQRALEVYRITGMSMTQLHQAQTQSGQPLSRQQAAPDFHYQVCQMAIAPNDRSILHQRIARRFHAMIDQGLIDEVRRLFERGDLSKELPSIRSVGYRQVWEYLEQRCSYEEMVERGIVATRQLAKRQLTWLRGWQNLHWIMTKEYDDEGILQEKLLSEALQIIAMESI